MTRDRRLRVLHLGRFYQDISRGGGIQRHVQCLLAGLAREVDVDNLVAAERTRGDVVALDGFLVHRAPCYGIFAGTALAPALVSWAQRLYRERRYDIVHVHFPDPLSHVAASLLPQTVRRVVTWHSDIVRQRHLLRLYRPWLDRFLSSVDAVIASTPANFDVSTQLDAVPQERRHVIPFGIEYAHFDDPAVFVRADKLRGTTCGGAPLILTVGRHVYYKGLEYLIEAMPLLPRAHLVLIGSGPLSGALRTQAAALGVANRVHFAGQVDDQDLAAWYRACDVFCLPSTERAETFGIAQLEAMACGKPVVGTRLGTGADYLNIDGVTGFTVAPRDAQALAHALARLTGDADLALRMGAAAMQRARGDFSRATMVERTLALYRKIVAS